MLPLASVLRKTGNMGDNESVRRKRIQRYEKEKQIVKRKRLMVASMILGVTMILYLLPMLFFIQHFNYGTSINKIDVSFKKVQQVNAILEEAAQQYQLTINGPNNQSEILTADQMGLSFQASGQDETVIKKEQLFLWFMPVINNEKEEYIRPVKCDEALLKKNIEELTMLSTVDSKAPVNASIKYVDSNYEIMPEVLGIGMNKDEIYHDIFQAISQQQSEIDLAINTYTIEPKYTKNSEKLLALKQELNQAINAKITYLTTTGEITVDKTLIHKWITIDNQLTMMLDETAIIEYLATLKETGAIEPTMIEFMTFTGNMISLNKGSFSPQIDIEAEAKRLIEDIKAGNNITRQPTTTSIGKTYVEIDLSTQHLWLIKEGDCLIDGDVVTGNVRAGHKTPTGLFKIYSKGKNVVLRGEDYASPVTYWMPFNGGIGIHDASWRNEFGGTIYKTNGSHGCINCPYDLAKTVYSQVDVGMPVVCYN